MTNNSNIVYGIVAIIAIVLISAGIFMYINSSKSSEEETDNTPSITKAAENQDSNKPGNPVTPSDTKSVSTPVDCKGHWAEQYINLVVKEGFATGYPDGSFQPNSLITRAEIAALMIRASRSLKAPDPSSVGQLPFKDDKEIPAWVRGYVALSAHKGYLKGYEDGTFKPQGKVSRQELCVIMARYYDIEKLPEKPIPFVDANTIPNWSRPSISRVLQIGIIQGYPDKTFKPTSYITRAEVCAMTVRGYEFWLKQQKQSGNN